MKKMHLILALSLLTMSLGNVFAKGSEGGFGEKFKSLDLSKEQLEKLKENRSGQKEKMKASRKEMKALKEQIHEGFKSNLSDSELEKLHAKLKEKKSEMEDLRFSKLIYLKNILNDEQRKKFSALKDEHKGKWKHKKMQGEEKEELE